MKIVKSLAMVSSLIILTSPAFGDDRPHQGMGGMGPSSGTMMQGGSMGMMDMHGLQDRLKSMQQLMDRLEKTNDPANRRALMREHMEQMQKLMGDMHGMMGPGMMGGNMSTDDRQKFMGQRLDIMQQMMEQMLEQQSQMMK
jgi:hypothetical protein